MGRRTTLKFVCALVALELAACSNSDGSSNGTGSTGGSGAGPAMSGGTSGGSLSPATGGSSSVNNGGTPATTTGGAAASHGGSAAAGENGTAGAGGNAGSAGAALTGGTAGVSTGGGSPSGGASSAGAGGAPAAGAGNNGGTAGATSGGSSTAGNAGAAGAGGGASRPARVLLYSFSTLDIPSVPAQLSIYKQKLEGWQYQVDQSKDPAVFSDASLAKYAAVGMINTCFEPFGKGKSGDPESQALKKFLQQGGGLFGVHCADVAFQSANPAAPYSQLLGGRASSQSFEGKSDCRKLAEHPTVTQLPETFQYTGNLDATDFIATDTTVLVKCKWGDASAKDVAVSWVRNEGTGRVFFSSFGKVDADLTNATIGDKHILAGLAWVLGR